MISIAIVIVSFSVHILDILSITTVLVIMQMMHLCKQSSDESQVVLKQDMHSYITSMLISGKSDYTPVW